MWALRLVESRTSPAESGIPQGHPYGDGCV
jgi:hypothetical protein